MRLINTETLEIRLFMGTNLPQYAILSHTWGDGELTLQEMDNLDMAQLKKGFAKIRKCCQIARERSLEWAWVDTVCIDKTSSAELTEAINSMFAWYKDSAICYAFLEDFDSSDNTFATTMASRFASSKWFTRGWTLQELIAPKEVIFFAWNWAEFATKTSWCGIISEITGIDAETLCGRSVRRISVARRMSWVSKRETTRPEDLAYCLLGIFGVHMPMLYGEGDRAFIRLQEEILKTSSDHSIFAWSLESSGESGVPHESLRYLGLLAPSPKYFKNSGHWVPLRVADKDADVSVTNRGISITVPSCPFEYPNRIRKHRIVLQCRPENDASKLSWISVVQLRTGQNDYARVSDPPGPLPVDHLLSDMEDTDSRTIFVRKDVHEDGFEEEHLVNTLWIERMPVNDPKTSGYVLADVYPSKYWGDLEQIVRASPFPTMPCGAVMRFAAQNQQFPSFIVVLIADERPNEEYGWADDYCQAFAWPKKSAETLWHETVLPWIDQHQRTGSTPELFPPLPKTTVNGQEVFSLGGGCSVKLSCKRLGKAWLGNMAVISIEACAN